MGLDEIKLIYQTSVSLRHVARDEEKKEKVEVTVWIAIGVN